MKKTMCKLLILIFTLIVFPVNAYTLGSIDTDVTEITVEERKTKTYNIEIFNIVGDVKIKSTDTEIATVDLEEWFFDTLDNDTYETENEKTKTITVTGKKKGTTAISLEIKAYTYDDTADSNIETTKAVTVTVVEATEPVTEYDVVYNANGGEKAPQAEKKEAGKELTLSSTKPTKKGYEFVGWNTEKDGKGKSYEAGGKYTEDSSVKLYAQWKRVSNVNKNPQTGDTLIYVVLLLTLGALLYSYWYMKKASEN